jgi:hypothetical protein
VLRGAVKVVLGKRERQRRQQLVHAIAQAPGETQHQRRAGDHVDGAGPAGSARISMRRCPPAASS